MSFRKAAQLLGKLIETATKGFALVSACCLGAMMLVTVADVTMRYLGKPLPGFFETTKVLLVCVVFFAIAHTQVVKGHVNVEFLVSRFPARLQGLVDSLTSTLAFALFGLLVWRTLLQGKTVMEGNQVSGTLGIPIFPFYGVIVVGGTLLCLVFIIDLVQAFARMMKK
jgi:TRAP-type C4-dicarboxylate transport system permease small subunit